MSQDSVICIIPARGGSKGLSHKNLRELDGITLVEHPIKHALESGVVDTVLVTTDDRNIAEVPIMRPKNLSEDLSTTEETIQHALLTYESLKSRKFKESKTLVSMLGLASISRPEIIRLGDLKLGKIGIFEINEPLANIEIRDATTLKMASEIIDI